LKFFNKQLLKQARDSIKKMIDESPENITIYRKPMVDDGYDGEVIDPYGEGIPNYLKVRLSQEKKYANYERAPVGLSTNLVRYIITDYKSIIYDGDTFNSSFDKEFIIKAVDPLIKFGGLIGYQAPLVEAVTMTTET